jgi:hypothetical protein
MNDQPQPVIIETVKRADGRRFPADMSEAER